ncbi:cation transporter [Syntrophotalea acetylenivorans]|uniref:Cation transporter n=1 Tax=Syntrophotalea acetylenivorans TaxID=1842532 RepID=A0A1L3GRW7_9BACT|nr:cation diffusion facilitator family transporter [Syntrophotalea acetylenivorans]APG28673.1 cation transporter [Syntrophotalea acetylenivorans]
MTGNFFELKNKQALQRGQRVALVATLATLLLALLKASVGWYYRAPVLVADAFHSVADLLAIFASYFGLWLAGKKKSDRFPYGLYKAETLITLMVGGLIVWAGVELLTEGLDKLQGAVDPVHFPLVPLLVSGLSVVLSLGIALKERQVGRAINSPSLLANAGESFLDVATSLVVLAGLLLRFWRLPYVEGAVILLIALLVIKLGGSSCWTAFLLLLDANLDPQLSHALEKQVNAIYGVKGQSEVRIRQAGPFHMVECVIYTRPTLSLYRAHELADKAEQAIAAHCPHIESVFVHVEPLRNELRSAIVPVSEINGMQSCVHGHFGRAPYFMLLRLNEHEAEIEDFYFNEFLGEPKFIGLKVIKAIIAYRIDLLFTSRLGEISFYMLKDNFVDIYAVDENQTVQEVVDRFRSDSLQAIMQPTHSVDHALVEQQTEPS